MQLLVAGARSRADNAAALLAIIRVGADKGLLALRAGDHVVEEGLSGTAEAASARRRLDSKRVVLEVETYDIGIRRDGINALLPPGAEQQQSAIPIELRIV